MARTQNPKKMKTLENQKKNRELQKIQSLEKFARHVTNQNPLSKTGRKVTLDLDNPVLCDIVLVRYYWEGIWPRLSFGIVLPGRSRATLSVSFLITRLLFAAAPAVATPFSTRGTGLSLLPMRIFGVGNALCVSIGHGLQERSRPWGEMAGFVCRIAHNLTLRKTLCEGQVFLKMGSYRLVNLLFYISLKERPTT